MGKQRTEIDKMSISETMLLLDIYRGTNFELRNAKVKFDFAFLKGKNLIRGNFIDYKKDVSLIIMTMKGIEYVNLLTKI